MHDASETERRSNAGARDIVLIGTSAGGVQALQVLLGGLPADLGAAVFVVLHVPEGVESRLPAVLRRASALPVDTAREGEQVRPGRVLVAPSGAHLLLREDRVQVRRGPKENGVRPSVDVLFRSAAMTYGARVLSVVLTGLLDDGAAGSKEVLRRGGIALAQEPASAEYPSMPRNALAAHPDVHAIALADLASMIGKVVAEPAGPAGAGSADVDPDDDADIRLVQEMAVSAAEPARAPLTLPGDPSLYNCADCNGVLQEASSESIPDRWRCRVGHGWSGMALVQAKAEQVEAALWAAVHLLEERALLCERLAERAAAGGRTRNAGQLCRRADEASRQVELVRGMVIPALSPAEDAESSALEESAVSRNA
ncbi:MAG: chemotaxis protein CheB [Geodermatophilaceae bacterium]|nr:chemotaxis protein CheB [Geodermatophilaceae bacterium]MDQ3455262.1 chemotaxis protein CheB [Actinomycetota bacterium]